MNLPFIVEHGIYGPRITMTGPWTGAIAEYMKREGVRELYLNHARGWKGTSLDFLRAVPELLAFSILDFIIEDITPIHELTALRALEVSTYCTTEIDFHQFPDLERSVFYWRGGSESLFDCHTIRWLFLHRYGGRESGPLARLSTLEQLSIANSELREIESVGALKSLRFLGLYNLKKLKSLSGVQCLEHLTALELNGCRGIGNIDDVAALVHLRSIQLNDDGQIASLSPLRDLVDLEEVLFYESTNIVDGNLTPLTTLPRLRNVSFQNRRHYSHKREMFFQPSTARRRANNG